MNVKARRAKCTKCGMLKKEWIAQKGYNFKGAVYCCAGCAQDTGCICKDEKPFTEDASTF